MTERIDDDLVEFVRDLVQGNELEGAAAGVAAKVVSASSLDGLTGKQQAALTLGLKEWIVGHFRDYNPGFVSTAGSLPPPVCADCTNPLPWSEVYRAGTFFDGHCSYCEQVRHKDD